MRRVSCLSGAWPSFPDGQYVRGTSAILWSCPQCFRTRVSAGSDRGSNEADKASAVAAFGRGGAKGRLLAHGLGIVLGSRDQPAPNPALAGTQLGTSCLTGLTWICQRKETVTKFLPCSLKKLQGLFFLVVTHKAPIEKPLWETKLICAVGR